MDTRLKLWVGVLAGPVAWAVQLQAVYAEAAWAVGNGPHWLLHATSLACLLAAVAGGWLAWQSVSGWPSDRDEPAAGRTRFLALLGVMSGATFALVIVAQWVAAMTLANSFG